jgi:hypothetical protein
LISSLTSSSVIIDFEQSKFAAMKEGNYPSTKN